ncbi:MAG: hypothetical protein IPJ81_18910 [Chitinophagaceae bacterium]|nr:hypothetical protein [Chitinophagaceae bacterium]
MPLLTLTIFSTAQTGLVSYPSFTKNDKLATSGTTGNFNSFFGMGAGIKTTNSATGNSFFGSLAGVANTTGNYNVFIGIQAGYSNTTGNSNTFIGDNAGMNATNLSNATAIGAGTKVNCSNCLTLGNDKVNVGIGTAAPQTLLSLGTTIKLKKLALHDDANSWYGFGIQAGQMRLQVGHTGARFSFLAGDSKEVMTVFGNGKVGIGTTTPQSALAVKGTITAQEVEVTINGWADYVFQNDYKLKPLHEVEQFIKENKHLPEVPSEKEVKENGNNLGKMDAVLLQKIEELTLYLIEQNKSIELLKKENETLGKKIANIENK